MSERPKRKTRLAPQKSGTVIVAICDKIAPNRPLTLNAELRERLQEHDRVIICEHLESGEYKSTSYWRQAGLMHRDDGTSGVVRFAIACKQCSIYDLDARFIEYFWREGAFHCVDTHLCSEHAEQGRIEAKPS